MKIEVTVLTVDGSIKFSDDVKDEIEIQSFVNLFTKSLDIFYVSKEELQKDFQAKQQLKTGKINA